VINRIGFMAGAEIEDSTASPDPAIAAAEYFASLEPGDEDLLIRRRDSERFAVTLRVLQFNETFNTLCDRMARIDHPDALALTSFPPAKMAACAHQPAERFGKMPGVQNNQSHAFKHAFLHPRRDSILHFV